MCFFWRLMYLCGLCWEFWEKDTQTNSQGPKCPGGLCLAGACSRRTGWEQLWWVQGSATWIQATRVLPGWQFCFETSSGFQRLKLSASELIPHTQTGPVLPLSAQISCHELCCGVWTSAGAAGPPLLIDVLSPAPLSVFHSSVFFFFHFER